MTGRFCHAVAFTDETRHSCVCRGGEADGTRRRISCSEGTYSCSFRFPKGRMSNDFFLINFTKCVIKKEQFLFSFGKTYTSTPSWNFQSHVRKKYTQSLNSNTLKVLLLNLKGYHVVLDDFLECKKITVSLDSTSYSRETSITVTSRSSCISFPWIQDDYIAYIENRRIQFIDQFFLFFFFF